MSADLADNVREAIKRPRTFSERRVMIDFDQFWAEAGIWPGLNREDTEAERAQLEVWLQSHPEARDEFDESLQSNNDVLPGVTDEQIATWESEHDVRLPEVLRQGLARQNGGFVRDNPIRVLPLAEIEPLDDEFWEWAAYDEQDVPDRDLMFQFAEDEFSGSYFLNYGAGGPEQEPSVFVYHNGECDLERCADSVTTFFSDMLKTFDSPSVNWSETSALDVVMQETIDLFPIYNGAAEKEQILARQGTALVLYVHERSPAGEMYSKIVLPEPLLNEAAMVQSYRPAPVSTYNLMLQPDDSEGVVWLESRRTSDGRWKNSKSRGSPHCAFFESANRARLEALRRDLFGQETADRAQSQEESQQRLQAALESQSPDERQAAKLQMMSRVFEQLGGMRAARSPLPDDAPFEIKALHNSLQQKLSDAEQRIREEIAKHPDSLQDEIAKSSPGSDILRQLAKINPDILRLFGTESPDKKDEQGK